MVSKAERRKAVYLFVKARLPNPDYDLSQKSHAAAFLQLHREALSRELPKGPKQESIIATIQDLAMKDVFDSETRARQHLPELFLQVPSKSAPQSGASKRPAPQDSPPAARSERPLTRAEARARRALTQGRDVDDQNSNDPRKRAKPEPIFPNCLSLTGQHTVLSLAQKMLEECCFQFCKTWIPDVVEEEKWTCALAVELNLWPNILERHFDRIPGHATTAKSAAELRRVLARVMAIRHLAVHREVTDAKFISELLRFAVQVASTLNDRECAVRLEVIGQHLSAAVKNLETQKDNLKGDLDHKTRHIRAEIDRLEQELCDTDRELRARDQSMTENVCEQMSEELTEAMRRLSGFATVPVHSTAMVPYRPKAEGIARRAEMDLAQ